MHVHIKDLKKIDKKGINFVQQVLYLVINSLNEINKVMYEIYCFLCFALLNWC